MCIIDTNFKIETTDITTGFYIAKLIDNNNYIFNVSFVKE
jgi:hypothetical protein